VGYAEVGRSSGPAVILLHGWPYDRVYASGCGGSIDNWAYRS
jgi:hypothetical protein